MLVVVGGVEGAEDGGHRHLFNGALASGVSDFFFEFAGARVGKEAKGTGRQRLKSAARWGMQKNAYDGRRRRRRRRRA
jgi:nucleoid-associated protein YejK